MFGFILAIAASFLLGTTTTMQKQALRKMKKLMPRKMIKNKLWALSFVIGIVGMLLYALALRYESILVVQPIISASFVIPVIAGHYIFGEKIGTRWVHIILILMGVVLLSA